MIATSYRNYDISFSEDDEKWKCHDLSIEAEKLSAVKRRIDEISKSERAVNVRAMFAGRGRLDEARGEEVLVTVLCEPEREYRSEAVKTVHCWGKLGGQRVKLRIENIVPLEHRADLETWAKLDAEAEAARKRAYDFLEAIPRHDADSLMLAAREAGEEKAQKRRRRA